MEIEERTDGAAVVVSLDGRADGFTGTDLEARLYAIIERGDVNIVMDCSRMTYINSVGLRVLFICARNCKAEGGSLKIAAAQRDCRTTMEISGFQSIIDFYDSSEDAIATI